jgi:LacI family transcriptional regulator
MIKTRVTLKNIAEVLGLSYSTVSRALNNHPYVKQETKARILKVAEEMEYRPNLFAKGLVKRKSNLLGLLVYDFRNTFYADFTRITQDMAEEQGYIVIHANTDDKPAKTELLVNSMMSIGVDGIIFASVRFDDAIVKNLIEEEFPVVMANRRLGKKIGDYVVIDNEYGAYLAVNHLIHLRRRRIAMIKGTEETSTGKGRFSGYLKALKENGLKPDEELIKPGTYTEESGHQWGRRLMHQKNSPDAIFCGDDEIALGVIRAVEELGLSVPKDVAVVGFDDSNISSHPRIQLTTVSQDIRRMSITALDILVHKIEKPSKKKKHIILQPNLIIRKSCGFQDTG